MDTLPAAVRPANPEAQHDLNEANAFIVNASTIVASIIADAEALERADASWQLEAIRSRARQITRLAYVASDQLERTTGLVIGILDGVGGEGE